MFEIEHIPGFILALVIWIQYVKVINEGRLSFRCFVATSMFIYTLIYIGFMLTTMISSIFLT